MKIPDLSWPDTDCDYDENLLLDIEAGVIAYLYRGRNAWNSTWVRHRYLNTHLFSDVGSAQGGAESLRERGNVFYIREVPALLLRGPREAVIVCDVHDDAPFAFFAGLESVPTGSEGARWIDGIYPGVSLRDAVDAFDIESGNWDSRKTSTDSILKGIVPEDFVFSSREGDLQSFTSYARGSDYLLGWISGLPAGSPSSTAVEAIAARWRALSELALSGAPLGADRASSFVDYRRRVLNAMPHSLWLLEVEAARAAAEAARATLRDAWLEARERCDQVMFHIHEAEAELRAATSARLQPADTSAGIRAQRERVNDADKALKGLRSDLIILQAIEQLRRDEYWDA